MPLGELPDAERTCARCEHDDADSQALCGGCSRAWNNGHTAGAPNDYWSETGRSVRERAEKLIAELAALVPHPGDGSCDRCGVVPATHVPMSLCPECYGTEKRIEDLEDLLRAALCQGAHVDIDGYIDTCHLSTWDEIAEYLEECGKLVRTEHGYRMVGE